MKELAKEMAHSKDEQSRYNKFWEINIIFLYSLYILREIIKSSLIIIKIIITSKGS